MNYTQDIEYILQPFLQKENIITLNSYIFIYNKIKYLVSVTHGLPISSCLLNNEKVSILKYPTWNELLICDPIFNYSDTKIIKKYKTKIPHINEPLYIKIGLNSITLLLAEYKFINLNNLPTNPNNVYFYALVEEGEIYESMSGCPILDGNDNLIGTFSQKELKNNKIYAYIIPSYYLIKTLTKLNNNAIFEIDYDDSIYKINKNIINTDNMIFHKSLGLYIPIYTWALIEGDDNIIININNQFDKTFIDITNELQILNSNLIIYDRTKIKISSTLLKFLKLYLDHNIILKIFNIIRTCKNIKYLEIIEINNETIDSESFASEPINEKNREVDEIINYINYNNNYYNFIFSY